MIHGKEEVTCPQCRAIHVVTYIDGPQREKGTLLCIRCGGVLLQWNGSRDYDGAVLKD